MDKKEEFKNFISKHPEILEYIKQNIFQFFSHLFYINLYRLYHERAFLSIKNWEKFFSQNLKFSLEFSPRLCYNT